jgi:hypothetical protein
MPRNANYLMKLEADELATISVSNINEQIAEGPVTDPEEFNLMLIELRNVIKAQQNVIRNFGYQLDIRP